MILYYITDRRQLQAGLVATIQESLRHGVNWVQVREKDLTGRQLQALVANGMHGRPAQGRVLVNGRVDVALAAGADGVHLPADALPPSRVRRLAPQGFQIGASCHSIDEVCRAEAEGADFGVFGPVFETASKRSYGPPQGLDRLSRACLAVKMPVLALGGISLSNAGQCLQAGAAGIAGISLFQQPASLPEIVASLRSLSLGESESGD